MKPYKKVYDIILKNVQQSIFFIIRGTTFMLPTGMTFGRKTVDLKIKISKFETAFIAFSGEDLLTVFLKSIEVH